MIRDAASPCPGASCRSTHSLAIIMRSLRPTTFLVALSLTVGAVRATAQDAGDTIRRAGGQVLRNVEVLSETLTEVKFKQRGKTTSIPSREVTEIDFGGTGEVWNRAKFALSRSDFRRAADLFQETADKGSRAVVKSHAGFQAASALYLAATADTSVAATAASALSSWIGSNADHRLLPMARLQLGKALLLAGKSDEALAAFKTLGTEASAKDLGPTWVARAKAGLGQALVAKGDFDAARTAYLSAAAVLRTTDSKDAANHDLLVTTQTAQGECYIAEKRYQEAASFFRDMANRARNDPALIAAGRCGEAQANYEAARLKKDMSAVRDAQDVFAQISATDLADGDATAKAVYYLAQTILTLGKTGEGTDYSSRATRILKSVVDSYPNSRWASQARRKKN